jgi:hypothetical protein
MQLLCGWHAFPLAFCFFAAFSQVGGNYQELQLVHWGRHQLNHLLRTLANYIHAIPAINSCFTVKIIVPNFINSLINPFA